MIQDRNDFDLEVDACAIILSVVTENDWYSSSSTINSFV
jgi:hypothetical protein